MTAGEKCYKLEKRQGERRLHLRREGDRGVRGGTKGQEGVTIQTQKLVHLLQTQPCPLQENRKHVCFRTLPLRERRSSSLRGQVYTEKGDILPHFFAINVYLLKS